MGNATVTINGTDMFEKYKALLAEKHSVQPPTPKTFYQDVPGADGSMDLSTSISGRPIYERRQISMNFNSMHTDDRWPTVFSQLLKEFHGKEGKIIFGDDPNYYYLGRMIVSDYERNGQVGTFAITANAEPYKYELLSSMDDWLWDPFDFETGLIRSYKDLAVNGESVLTIPGTERWVIPEFMATGSLSVSFEGKNYTLKEGTSKIYAIVIKEGDNLLTFNGSGTVSVNYRGGIL